MRRLLIALAVMSVPLAATTLIPSYIGTMLNLFFSMFVAAGYIIAAMAYATGIYSSRYSGLIAGLGAGSWSAVVAVLMPAFGELFDMHRYSAAFALAATFPAIATTVWMTLNRVERN